MFRISLFAICLVSLSCFASEDKSGTIPKLKIGINVSPDFCFRLSHLNVDNDRVRSVKELNDAAEIPKAGYTLGLNVGYDFKSWVGIESGLQYSNKGYQRKKEVLYLPYPSSYTSTIHQRYDFHYLDIPLKVNFTVGKKKVRFFSSIGFITNFFLAETDYTTLEIDEAKKIKNQKSHYNYNIVNVSPMLSLGIDYKINNKMNLRIEPTVRFGALKIIDAPLTAYLYNAGLNVSYYFGIK